VDRTRSSGLFNEFIKDLTLEYNKIRQAAITTELIEIATIQMSLSLIDNRRDLKAKRPLLAERPLPNETKRSLSGHRARRGATTAANYQCRRSGNKNSLWQKAGRLGHGREGHVEGNTVIEEVAFRIESESEIVPVVDVLGQRRELTRSEAVGVGRWRRGERFLKELGFGRRARDKRWNYGTIGEVVDDIAYRNFIEWMVLECVHARLRRRVHQVNEKHVGIAVPVGNVGKGKRRTCDADIAQIDVVDPPRVAVVMVETVQVNRIWLK
jgi:hypothetical protein